MNRLAWHKDTTLIALSALTIFATGVCVGICIAIAAIG